MSPSDLKSNNTSFGMASDLDSFKSTRFTNANAANTGPTGASVSGYGITNNVAYTTSASFQQTVKQNDGKGNVISANGVKREFEIAISQGLIPIPIAATGYITQEVFDEIFKAPEKYYVGMEWAIPIIKELASDKLSADEIIQKVITIIQTINK
jgi:hypothetical protein